MITQPRRSVTRFFIPLIDVLILLFCIFLLMPFVSRPEGAKDVEPPPEDPAGRHRLRDRGSAGVTAWTPRKLPQSHGMLRP